MKDIAEELGLSIVTISKVLRDHPDISPQTRERVLKYVRARDYQPNTLARSLVTGRSLLIGLVVPDLLHPFFAEIAKSLSRAIRREGYSLLISSSEEDPKLESQELRHMLSRRIDGVVVASTSDTGDTLKRSREENQTVLLIDRNFGSVADAFVGVDDFEVGRLATDHLVQFGCKRIAHIGGRDNSTGSRRLEGFRAALKSAGLPCRESQVIRRKSVDVDSMTQGANAAKLLLTQKTPPDGIFCYNDPLAIGAMHVILESGRRIPEDIALIGCGNLHYDESLRVPLSSIDQQTAVIGERAGKMMLEMIAGKGAKPPEQVILEPSLVVRASSLRPGSK